MLSSASAEACTDVANEAAKRPNVRRGETARIISMTASAISVAFCTGAVALTALCFSVLISTMMVFRVAEQRRTLGGVHDARWKMVLTITNFLAVGASPGFALICLSYGGEIGRVIASLQLVNAVLSIILNYAMGRSRILATAILPLIGLALVPLWPVSPAAMPHWVQVIALYLSMCCLFASFLQTLADQRQTMTGLREATVEAQARSREAEEGRQMAEAAARAKSDFMIMMSHEFRTPLNAVIGYGEILHEDLSAEGRTGAAQDANRVCEAGRRLLDMVEQVLDLTAADQGEAEFEPVPVEFVDIVDEMAQSGRKLAQANGNAFRVTIEEGLDGGLADVGKIRQCLSNLLSNACKFTSAGHVSLMARRSDDGEGIEFIVSDTGVGIPEAKLADLFQPFRQGESGFRRSFDGAGLGLALTRRLALIMGGDVTVESAPGFGSSFTLRVPYLPLPASHAASAA